MGSGQPYCFYSLIGPSKEGGLTKKTQRGQTELERDQWDPL